MTEKSPDTRRAILKRRLALTAGAMAIWSLVIVARLVYLQVFQFATLTAYTQKRTSKQPIPAKRGEIRDRNGEPLAWSMDAPSIFFDRSRISDPTATVGRLCDALGDCSAGERDSFVRKINGTGSAVLRRNITKEQVERIGALELSGIGITPESHRSYPHGSLAAHALGFVGAYGEGQGGVEKKFDTAITGQTGEVLFQRDAKRFVYDRVVLSEPTEGASLDLTINISIQHIVEQELKKGVTENHAEGGTAIVVVPSTGEVVAMASYPTFDPNVRPATGQDPERRNRAIQDTIEPGSMFKIVVATAALEQKVVTPESLIDVSDGRIKVGRYTIEDTHTHGTLSFQDVIAKSSNVGAIKVARLLGAERFTEVARRLGFGRRTAIELFGESPGSIADAGKLNDMALASEAIGYHVAVTPMQMVMAVNSIANGGELLRPRLLRAITRSGVRYETSKTVVNPTMTPSVVAQLTAMMEEVVEHGTATSARIPGYTVAGKTGTAEKLVDGSYSKSEHISSFVGFLPSRAPEYTIIVVIDSPHGPKGYFGGQVAAPIFKRIGEALLHRSGIPPTVNPPTPLLVRREAPRRDRPVSGPSERPAVISAALADGLMPDLTGLSAREAATEIARLGLTLRVEGVGLVRGQSPAPGVPLGSDTSVTVRLGQRPLLARTANVERR
ncbi:MAG TPA: penicillin-binding protein [Vicinamibacterales bacterium]|nr:penicillin-binding protein [Vicinamibacterales bacterium]